MGKRVCPWWLGYVLANPARRWLQKPEAIVAPYLGEGMVVLEPGPGMGFFTLPMARMVGPSGKVIAVDVQAKMLDGLHRRAARAHLLDRIDPRLSGPDWLGVNDLSGSVDFVLAFAVVHELPSVEKFFQEAASAMKQGALLLLAEPAGHVVPEMFGAELLAAQRAGLAVAARPAIRRSHAALLKKG